MRERSSNCGLNMIDVQRLGNVIESADTHRLDGVVNSLLAADHYDHRIRILCENDGH